MNMTLREKRILHQIDAVVEGLETSHAHVAYESGADCPEALGIHKKMCAMKALRDQAMNIFNPPKKPE